MLYQIQQSAKQLLETYGSVPSEPQTKHTPSITRKMDDVKRAIWDLEATLSTSREGNPETITRTLCALLRAQFDLVNLLGLGHHVLLSYSKLQENPKADLTEEFFDLDNEDLLPIFTPKFNVDEPEEEESDVSETD